MKSKAPLVVIAGPTASGKTSLAIEIAKKFNGEIICADSRTIYRGMDIGTAKPTTEEQAVVKHWGIDLVNPGQRFSASDFKKYANEKIAEIRQRGKVPFLVGGSGLYVDAVIFDYSFGSDANEQLRAELSKMSIEELHKIYNDKGIALPDNKLNKRYLIRGIERSGDQLKRNDKIIDNTIVVGISTDRDVLRRRIALRSEQIFSDGAVKEAAKLGEIYGWDNEAMTGNIYPLARQYLAGEITLDEAKRRFNVLDWHLAKRQLTWLKRNRFIKWGSREELSGYLNDLLEKLS